MVKRKKEIKHYNFAFWCVLSLVTITPILATAFSVFNSYWNWFSTNLDGTNLYTNLGIALQIVSTLVCCLISVLGISISLQKDSYLKVPIKVIFNLRRKPRFNFVLTSVISIILLCSSITAYTLNQLIVCVTCEVMSLLLITYFMITEIPYLTLQDRAIIRIIKDGYITVYNGDYSKSIILQKYFKELVWGIISCDDKGCIWLYESVKDKRNDDFNKYLLMELLEVQSEKSFELEKIESKKQLIEATDKLLDTVCDMTNGYFDITEILGEKTSDYQHLLTRVLFRLLENPVSKENTEHRISEMLKWCFGSQESTTAKSQLYFSVLTVLFIEKIKSNDFSLAEKTKIALSTSYFSLQKPGLTARIFLMISFIMYYLVEIEHEVPEETKKNIQSFIDSSGIVDKAKMYSWKQLYKFFASTFPVSLIDFLSDFKMNEHYFQFYLDSCEGHWVVLDEKLATDWYLSNYFNSERDVTEIKFDYLLQSSGNQERTYYLKELEKELFPAGKDNFVPSERFKKCASFYLETDADFHLFEIVENRTHAFRKYIQSLRKDEFEEKIKKSLYETNQKLKARFQPQLEKKVQSMFGFSNTIDLSSEPKLYFAFVAERFSEAINFDECTVDWFARSFENELTKKAIHPCTRVIKAGRRFDSNISQLVENEFAYVTTDIQFYGNGIQDNNVKLMFNERVKAAKTIDNSDRFFYRPTILLKDGFSFNCQLEFRVLDLPQEEIGKRVDECRGNDGSYKFDDTYFTREELTRLIQKTYAIFQVVFSYKVNTYKDSIIVLDMYSHEDSDEDKAELAEEENSMDN